MTLEEQLDIIQAAIDGKTVECKKKENGDEWVGVIPDFHLFDFDTWHYRIKPEPREWWLVMEGDKPTPVCAFVHKEFAEHKCLGGGMSTEQRTPQNITDVWIEEAKLWKEEAIKLHKELEQLRQERLTHNIVKPLVEALHDRNAVYYVSREQLMPLVETLQWLHAGSLCADPATARTSKQDCPICKALAHAKSIGLT